MNLTRNSADGSPEGLPVTIAATHLDGLVLSLTPNSRKYPFLEQDPPFRPFTRARKAKISK